MPEPCYTEDEWIDALTPEDWADLNDPDGTSPEFPRGRPDKRNKEVEHVPEST